MERSHRITGVLLLVLVAETLLLFSYVAKNAELNAAYERMREEMKVYVVPGSRADVYMPTRSDMLLKDFADHLTQSMTTYTYANLADQYREIRKFMTPELLLVVDEAMKKKVAEANSIKKSSLFIPDHQNIEVETTRDQRGRTTKKVKLPGRIQHIVGGSVQQVEPVVFDMTLIKLPVSETNPFGYRLAKYTKQTVTKQ